MPPEAFFSRGFNVGKLILLFSIAPMIPILPLLFFFLRKDRLICGGCRRLLPETAPMMMLPAVEVAAALGPLGPGSALVPFAHGGALVPTDPEAARLGVASRRARTRAVWFGVLAMPFTLPFLASLQSLSMFTFLFVGGPAAALVAGSVASFRRAQTLRKQSAEAEQRHQRRRVLQLARQEKGLVSVSRAAAHLNMDLGEAEKVLDSMVDGRLVDVEVTAEGRIVYVFRDLT
jgi:hypothetical protein